MKLSATEPLCSKDINSNLAPWLAVKLIEPQAVSKALKNSSKTLRRRRNNVRDKSSMNLNRLVNSNLQLANLSLAESIAAPPKFLLKFEPELLAENCQLEDAQTSKQPVWFRILVIEDNDSSCDRISKMLRGKDTQVIEAQDSKIAIQLAQRELPDLIICELMMPEIDGYGIKYLLQHSSLTNKIPLLFITTHTEQTDREGSAEPDHDSETILIADKNHIKPVTREKLCDAIADKLISSTQV